MSRTTATSEERANWRANWLTSVQELADLEMQRATWLNPNSGNPHYSFIEYVTVYFNDLSLDEANGGYTARIAENLLSDVEAAAASRLHFLLDSYRPPTDDYDHHAILEDPSWHSVAAAAKEAQALLSDLIVQPDERANLLQRSEYALMAATKNRIGPDVR